MHWNSVMAMAAESIALCTTQSKVPSWLVSGESVTTRGSTPPGTNIVRQVCAYPCIATITTWLKADNLAENQYSNHRHRCRHQAICVVSARPPLSAPGRCKRIKIWMTRCHTLRPLSLRSASKDRILLRAAWARGETRIERAIQDG